METVRKIINAIFWIVFIGGLLVLIVLLVGGAFPISINPSEQKIKFDITYWGWEPLDPKHSTMLIVHEKENVKEGFGALQFSYKKGRKRPGIKTEKIPVEGLTRMKFYMKAQKPGYWQVQIMRKSDKRIFHKTFKVGKKWRHYNFGVMDFVHEAGYKGKFSQTDLRAWIRFIPVNPIYKENTVWIDNIHLIR